MHLINGLNLLLSRTHMTSVWGLLPPSRNPKIRFLPFPTQTSRGCYLLNVPKAGCLLTLSTSFHANLPLNSLPALGCCLFSVLASWQSEAFRRLEASRFNEAMPKSQIVIFLDPCNTTSSVSKYPFSFD